MQETQYNGHKNYETWLASLYVDGNYTGEHTYLEVLELARIALTDERDTLEEAQPVNALYWLEDTLKDWFEEELPELDGIAADLMRAAASEIAWRDIAASKLAEVAEDQS